MFKLLSLLVIIISALQPSRPADVWAEPIPYLQAELQEGYLAPVTRFGSGHRGIDFYAELGQFVRAPQAGVIHFTGKVVNRQVVTVLTDNGKRASFEPVCSGLVIGTRVQAGEVIGRHCLPDESYEYHCESCVHASARDPFGYLSPLFLYGWSRPSVLIS
jgi:hypothetical protein